LPFENQKTDSMNSPLLSPTQPSDRIVMLDFLRGFALLGILMVNMPLMNAPMSTEVGEFQIWTDPVNTFASQWIKFFFTSKFYVLFSLLFGVGFYLFTQKGEGSGISMIPLFRRRLFWLLIFGIAHVTLLWYGDILVIYALVGFILLLFRRLKVKTMLVWAGIALMVPIVLTGLMVVMLRWAMTMPEAAAEIQYGFDTAFNQMEALTAEALVIYKNGTFSEIFRMRMTEYGQMATALFYFIPNVLALFLVGTAMARSNRFAHNDQNRRFYIKLLLWSLPVAIFGNVMLVYFGARSSIVQVNIDTLLYLAGSTFGGVSMAMVYLSLIYLLFHTRWMQQLGKWVAATGRMALTNYLMQTVICTTLFYSYGFGLYGSINTWQGILLTFAIFGVQLLWSRYWLNRYRYGPFEWLWRSLTYGKRFRHTR
jgi:uncharacterized protein